MERPLLLFKHFGTARVSRQCRGVRGVQAAHTSPNTFSPPLPLTLLSPLTCPPPGGGGRPRGVAMYRAPSQASYFILCDPTSTAPCVPMAFYCMWHMGRCYLHTCLSRTFNSVTHESCDYIMLSKTCQHEYMLKSIGL